MAKYWPTQRCLKNVPLDHFLIVPTVRRGEWGGHSKDGPANYSWGPMSYRHSQNDHTANAHRARPMEMDRQNQRKTTKKTLCQNHFRTLTSDTDPAAAFAKRASWLRSRCFRCNCSTRNSAALAMCPRPQPLASIADSRCFKLTLRIHVCKYAKIGYVGLCACASNVALQAYVVGHGQFGATILSENACVRLAVSGAPKEKALRSITGTKFPFKSADVVGKDVAEHYAAMLAGCESVCGTFFRIICRKISFY